MVANTDIIKSVASLVTAPDLCHLWLIPRFLNLQTNDARRSLLMIIIPDHRLHLTTISLRLPISRPHSSVSTTSFLCGIL